MVPNLKHPIGRFLAEFLLDSAGVLAIALFVVFAAVVPADGQLSLNGSSLSLEDLQHPESESLPSRSSVTRISLSFDFLHCNEDFLLHCSLDKTGVEGEGKSRGKIQCRPTRQHELTPIQICQIMREKNRWRGGDGREPGPGA